MSESHPGVERTVAALLLVVAIIHLLPLSGLLSADRLESLYGVSVTSPDLEILLRHRAVLFGLLGGFFAVSAFVPKLQPLAIGAALVSVISFLLLAARIGDNNEQLERVIVADWVALTCLALAATLRWIFRDPTD